MIEAFSNLDDDLVEKHFKAKEALKAKKAKPRKTVWLKWSAAVAACFCVILSMVIIIPNVLNTNHIETPEIAYGFGENAATKYGTITLTENDRTAGTCTFVFEKTTSDLLGFTIRGYVEEESYIDENGTERVKTTQYHIITPYEDYSQITEIPDNHVVLDNQLKITVNGQEVTELPTTPGTYEITVTYTALYEFLDYVEPVIKGWGFGNFMLEELD